MSQEQSALPVKNLPPVLGADRRFERVVALPQKKIVRSVDFPQHHSTYRWSKGLAGQLRPEARLQNLLNNMEKLRCESLF